MHVCWAICCTVISGFSPTQRKLARRAHLPRAWIAPAGVCQSIAIFAARRGRYFATRVPSRETRNRRSAALPLQAYTVVNARHAARPVASRTTPAAISWRSRPRGACGVCVGVVAIADSLANSSALREAHQNHEAGSAAPRRDRGRTQTAGGCGDGSRLPEEGQRVGEKRPTLCTHTIRQRRAAPFLSRR